jgi:hypothetical protein
MFGNGTKRKLLDLNFLVLIENFSFRSRILFPKRIYSICFGTKAAKRKLSILKERWFDIANQYTRAAYVFVPSVFGENISTAEFGMIGRNCFLGHRKKIAKF